MPDVTEGPQCAPDVLWVFPSARSTQNVIGLSLRSFTSSTLPYPWPVPAADPNPVAFRTTALV